MILKEQKAYLDHVLGYFYNSKADKMDLMRAANELYCDVQVKYLLTRRFIGSCSPAYAKQIACDCLKVLNRVLYDRRRIVGNIDETKLAKLLKGISDCWEYIFEDKDCGGKKEWLDLLDVSYYFISNGLKCGYYSISDTSKLFVIARTLEEKENAENKAAETAKNDRNTQQKEKPRNKTVVRAKKVDAKGTYTLKAVDIKWDLDAEDIEEGVADELPTEINIPAWMTDGETISDYITSETGFCHKGFRLVRVYDKDKEQLKVYRVAVRRTYYGEILIPAHSEEEAIEIATGDKPMYDGTWASEHFHPTEHDAYLELNDSLDDEGMVAEVKQSC